MAPTARRTVIALAAVFPRRNVAEIDLAKFHALRRLLLYKTSSIGQPNANQEFNMIDLYHIDSMLV